MKFPILTTLAALLCAAPAQEKPDADGFVSVFNGKDLTNWINVNCAPDTWGVKDGVITCTGQPTGALRLPKQYENFIVELEWRHMKSGGNAGIFVWSSPIAAKGVPFLQSIEVQVLDHGFNVKGKNEWYTTHGDVFPIHGATMVPLKPNHGSRSFPKAEHSKPSPEWNHYRIVCQDGSIRLSVNGHEVSGGDQCVWRKGFFGLESEGSPTEWRNIRIKELPSTNPKPEECAPDHPNWKTLFPASLEGWKSATPDKKGWTVHGTQFHGSKDAAELSIDPGKGILTFDLQIDQPAEQQGALICIGDAKIVEIKAEAKTDALPLSLGQGWFRIEVDTLGDVTKVTVDGKPCGECKASGTALRLVGPVKLAAVHHREQ